MIAVRGIDTVHVHNDLMLGWMPSPSPGRLGVEGFMLISSWDVDPH